MKIHRWMLQMTIIFPTILFVGSMMGADCIGTTGEDGGPDPVSCEQGDDQSVHPGKTGLTYVAVTDGTELPSWPRPQGGIGTRLNVRIDGFAEDDNFSALTVFMTKKITNPSDVAGEEGGPCIEGETESTCAEPSGDDPELTCIEGTCMLLVTEQVNRQFPLECQSDGSLLVLEMPVRYRSQLALEDVDAIEAELTILLEPNEDEVISSEPANVTLKVGDFIEPSWWETDDDG